MPRVKIDYIVSFSSEDPDNPCSNLLAWDVNKKKWLCSKGEAACSVVLQLNKAVKICSVNIGAYQSALVEVLVGRSETPNEPFQVLVPSSVFQSPAEARREAAADADRVRSFAADALAAARAQRWDRLRVVCSQPYNKHCKFGLSFVHVFSEDSPAPAPALPARLTAALELQSSDEEEFRPGELFAKHLQKPKDPPATGAQIRQATSHALRNIPDSSIKLIKTPIAKGATSGQRHTLVDSRGTEPHTNCIPEGGGTDRHGHRAAGGGGAGRQRDGLLRSADDGPQRRTERALHRRREQGTTGGAGDDRKGDKLASTSETQTRDEPSHKGDRPRGREGDKYGSPTNKDHGDIGSRKKNYAPSGNGRIEDAPSGNGRIEDAPSGNGRIEDAPSGNGRIEDAPSGNGRKDDAPSGNGRIEDAPSGNGRKDDAPSGNGRKVDAPSGNGRKGDGSRKRRQVVTRSDDDAAHELLAGVVFVLSGYENPQRARLRSTALALGAACEREWGPRCTHLICAFPNTPKLRAVRAGAGGARAPCVRGAWLEECARARRRLPWQWFATEPARRRAPPPGWDAPAASPHHSECDTDDEIERVRQKMKKRRASSPSRASPSRSSPSRASPSRSSPSRASPARGADESAASSSSDVTFVRDERLQGCLTVLESDSCGGSTDEEGGSPAGAGAGGAARGRGRLPALLAGRSFLVRGAAPRARLLERYLRAYGGLVLQEADSEVDYIVCDSDGAGAGEGAGAGAGAGGTRVRAAWLWRCHAERRLCPTRDYELATC